VFYCYWKSDDGGKLPHFGTINIDESQITITVNADEQKVIDIFKTQKVTYDEKNSKYRYKTDKGDIIIQMAEDQIKEIQNFTSIGMAIFNK
jgi:hypothetical protein